MVCRRRSGNRRHGQLVGGRADLPVLRGGFGVFFCRAMGWVGFLSVLGRGLGVQFLSREALFSVVGLHPHITFMHPSLYICQRLQTNPLRFFISYQSPLSQLLSIIWTYILVGLSCYSECLVCRQVVGSDDEPQIVMTRQSRSM